jgi:hypothetical protein
MNGIGYALRMASKETGTPRSDPDNRGSEQADIEQRPLPPTQARFTRRTQPVYLTQKER